MVVQPEQVQVAEEQLRSRIILFKFQIFQQHLSITLLCRLILLLIILRNHKI
jgi:hypothetical protein